jgi:serine/threonine protein kinase
MLHQDLKPDNIMIDATGTVKIIDFGATRVAGLEEVDTPIEQINLLGAAQYAAPEYFLGESGSARSDIFSLGVIAYQMLSGRLPYGAGAEDADQGGAAQAGLPSVLSEEREIPAWVDDAIRKAVEPDPASALRRALRVRLRPAPPEQAFLNKTKPAADRAPSGDVLEERVVRADAGFDRGQRGALSLNQPVWRPEGKCYGRPEKRAKIKMAAVGASQPASQRRRNKARSD